MLAALSGLWVVACGLTERSTATDGRAGGAGGEATAGGKASAGGSTAGASPIQTGDPSTFPFEPPIGGCSCQVDADGLGVSLSFQCFCAGFPDACPAYELAKHQQRYGFDGTRDGCGWPASWAIVESVGCGRRVLSSPPGFAGGTWQYDEATLELVAAELYSDIGFGPCGSYSYRAGEVASCDAASVCSLCDDSCAPACSIEAYASDHFGPVIYEDWVQNALAMCPYVIDGEPRPTLTRGCGAATLSTKYGEATFAEETKTATFVRWPSADKCGGEWGDPPPVCDEQVVCSLCEDGCR